MRRGLRPLLDDTRPLVRFLVPAVFLLPAADFFREAGPLPVAFVIRPSPRRETVFKGRFFEAAPFLDVFRFWVVEFLVADRLVDELLVDDRLVDELLVDDRLVDELLGPADFNGRFFFTPAVFFPLLGTLADAAFFLRIFSLSNWLVSTGRGRRVFRGCTVADAFFKASTSEYSRRR